VTEFGRGLSRSLRPAMEDATFSKFPSQGQRPYQAKNRSSFSMLGIELKRVISNTLECRRNEVSCGMFARTISVCSEYPNGSCSKRQAFGAIWPR